MTPLIEYDKKITQLIAAGRYDEALWVAEEELCYAESSYGHEHLETAKVLNNLGWICDVLNKEQSAEDYYLKALEVKIAVCGNTSKELIHKMEKIINFIINHNQLARAYEFLVKLIDLAGLQNKLWRLRKGAYLCQLQNWRKHSASLTRLKIYSGKSFRFCRQTMASTIPTPVAFLLNLALFSNDRANLSAR